MRQFFINIWLFFFTIISAIKEKLHKWAQQSRANKAAIKCAAVYSDNTLDRVLWAKDHNDNDVTPIITAYYKYDKTLSTNSLLKWLYITNTTIATLTLLFVRDNTLRVSRIDIDNNTELFTQTKLSFNDIELADLPSVGVFMGENEVI